MALISAVIILIFNVIFNIKSQHHHVTTTTYIPHKSPSSQQQEPSNTIKDEENKIISNSTQLLIQDINNEIKKSNQSECNLLFCDKIKFDLMIRYYKSVSSISFPSSWIELNDQLFCPIKYSSELNKNIGIISSAGQRILEYIYLNQFKKDCFDFNKNKYLFYDTSGWYSGLGATTNGGIIKYFSRALMSNRTFILVGEWDWSKNLKHCNDLNRTGFNCYFLSTSNCLYQDIINKIDKNDPKQFIQTKGVPKDCNLGDFPEKPWCEQTVIYINNNGAGWYPKNEDIDKWIHNKKFSNFQQYKAVIISFVYRLQPNVREIIYKKIKNAFIESFKTSKDFSNKFDPFQSIGFPIRASDKCRDNIMGIHGEMQCWTVDELNKLLISIKYFKPNINWNIIFTSEDINIIDQLILKMHETNNSNWNIIINHHDTKPIIGSAKFRNDNYLKKDNLIEMDKLIDTDFDHDVIVGALSSLLLQTANNKYIVHTKSSSWLDNLWNIAAQLNCESIFWSQQLEINGFATTNKQTHINQKPSFLHDINKRYHYLNKLCFELKQNGLLNKKVKWKHILFPPDIWEQIHVLNFNEKRFRNKFGIDILEYGWTDYCNRMTKPPFVLNDDVGV